MRRILAIIAVLWTLPLSAQIDFDELYDGDNAAAMRSHVEYIASSALKGRLAGSEGEKLAAEYLAREFENMGIDLLTPSSGEEFRFIAENGDTLCSRNIAAFIPGTDKDLSDRYIVIGARLDNLGCDSYTVNGETVERIYYGANGNASGLSMLIELARILNLNSHKLRRTVILAGFGASRSGLVGSWHFLNESFSNPGNIDAMIDLDMLGTGYSGFYAFTAGNLSMEAVMSKIGSGIIPICPEIVPMAPYQSDNIAFYDFKIPSVMFTTGRYIAHDSADDKISLLDFGIMEQELEYIAKYALELASTERLSFNNASEPLPEPGVVLLADCDVRPSFFGSTSPMAFLERWVYKYLKYPKESLAAGVQGRVDVDFIVDEKGKVKDVTVRNGVSEALDAEAVRVVSASPDWKPGKVGGKPVKTKISIPVEFKLKKK